MDLPPVRPFHWSGAAAEAEPYVVVLGVAQDGGHPQAGCSRSCCDSAWRDPEAAHLVSCVAVVDPRIGAWWMFDATPDLPRQEAWVRFQTTFRFSGLFLTHAHVGHYAGLVHLGPEAMAVRGLPVYAMPRMRSFLEGHAPWSRLVTGEHVHLVGLEEERSVSLATDLSVRPVRVPHRDELSETVGFVVRGPQRSFAYVPDIDRWEDWTFGLEALLDEVDVAYVDGTFFTEGEVPGRAHHTIAHPPIRTTLARLAALPAEVRSKVRFLHLNHSNPALWRETEALAEVQAGGAHVAEEGERISL